MSVPIAGPDERGWRRWRCSRAGCGKETGWTPHTPERIHFACLSGAAAVGTALHAILGALRINPDASCQCAAMQQQMNRWGPDGCRAHRGEIVAHLRRAYHKTDWPQVFTASSAALTSGLALKLLPFNAFDVNSLLGRLVDLAIDRAEAAGKSAGSPHD